MYRYAVLSSTLSVCPQCFTLFVIGLCEIVAGALCPILWPHCSSPEISVCLLSDVGIVLIPMLDSAASVTFPSSICAEILLHFSQNLET